MSSADDDRVASRPNAAFDQIRKDIIMGTTPKGRDTRFQPGKSGNPNGRPKKPPVENTAFSALQSVQAALTVSRATMTITEGGVKKEVRTPEALMRSLAFQGMKGNAYAANKAMEIMKEAELREAQDLQEEREFWNSIKDRYRVLQDAAKKNNIPIEMPIPHPDDVIVSATGPVQFVGPIDEAGQRWMEQKLILRELLFLQNAYDERFGPRKEYPQPYRSAAYLMLIALENSLPPRLRLTESERLDRTNRARRTTKLKLAKMLYRGWRPLNPNYRRGTIFPNLDWANRFSAAYFKSFDIYRKHFTPETTAEEMLDHPEVSQAMTEFLTIKFKREY